VQFELNAELYPNPAHDYFIISFDNEISSKEATISMYDLTGKLIQRNNLSGQKTTVNTSTLPSGFYTIIVSNKSGRKMFKMIKAD
jgi:hypothetical protein